MKTSKWRHLIVKLTVDDGMQKQEVHRGAAGALCMCVQHFHACVQQFHACVLVLTHADARAGGLVNILAASNTELALQVRPVPF